MGIEMDDDGAFDLLLRAIVFLLVGEKRRFNINDQIVSTSVVICGLIESEVLGSQKSLIGSIYLTNVCAIIFLSILFKHLDVIAPKQEGY